jgi:periodic tryptophan protein 2
MMESEFCIFPAVDGSHLMIPLRFIAVTHGSHVQVWRTPNHLVREFAPFVLHRTYTGHHADVSSIRWSPDSR